MTDASLDQTALSGQRPLHQELVAGLNTREMAVAVYALYMAAVFTGGLSAIGGAVIAHFACRRASSLLRSHFAYQLRTFWSGLLLVAIGGVMLTFTSLGLIVLLAAALYVMVRGAAGLGRVLSNRPARAPRGMAL